MRPPPMVKLGSLLLLSCLAAACGNARPAFTQTIAKTSAFIQQGMAQKELVGLSIALVHGGKIVWSQGFGFADKEKQIPARPDTVYMVGSTSKTLTAAGLLTLQDRGLLSVEDLLVTHVPEFAMAERFGGQREGVTLRRLLNHHSGVPGDIYKSGFVETSWDDWGVNLYMEWLLGYLRSDYPTYAPGQLGSYCNTGFVLAGEVLRRKGGFATFTEAMREVLFKPLGMTHTSFRKITQNLAAGYVRGRPVPPMETNIAATGGAYSTAEDMAQFALMLLGRGKHPNGARVLQPATVELMGEEEVSPLDLSSYMRFGLGLDTMADPALAYAGRAWAKNGSTEIFNAYLEVLPDRDLGVVVLANSDTAGLFVYAAAREALKNALGEVYGLPPAVTPLPALVTERDPGALVGKYALGRGWDEVVAGEAGALTWVAGASGGSPVRRRLTLDGDAFRVEGRPERLVFLRRAFGGQEHLLMVQHGSSGSEPEEAIFGGRVVSTRGERFVPQAIPAAWRARVGKIWLMDNIAWNDFSGWDGPTLRLSEKDGVLMGGLATAPAVLAPKDDALAFAVGTSNRGASTVRVLREGDREKLAAAGYEGFDVALVPELRAGEAKAARVDFDRVAWYRVSAAEGQRLRFALAGGSAGYRLRLYGEAFGEALASGEGVLAHTAHAGTYYLAVSRPPDAAGDFTLSLSN